VPDDHDTYDELDPIAAMLDESARASARRDPTGPVPRLAAGSDDHDRVEVPRAAEAKASPSRVWKLLRTYGIPVASGVAGCLSAVLVYTYAFGEGQGEAKATAREREAERAWLVKTVRDDLIPDVAVLKSEIRAVREVLRLYIPALRPQGTDPSPPGDP
jgi:hypothetical protein